jgi:hypothetical protein
VLVVLAVDSAELLETQQLSILSNPLVVVVVLAL